MREKEKNKEVESDQQMKTLQASVCDCRQHGSDSTFWEIRLFVFSCREFNDLTSKHEAEHVFTLCCYRWTEPRSLFPPWLQSVCLNKYFLKC